MRRKTYRTSGVLIAGAATIVTAPLVGAGTAQAYGPTGYTQNICGANGCAHYGDTSITTPLKDQLRYFRASGGVPNTVLLQEVCASQYNDFKNFLRNEVNGNFWGGQYNQASQTTGCSSAEAAWYGPASYLVASTDPTANTYKRSYATQGGSENRGLVCMYGDVFGTPYYSCATHLDVGNTHSAQFNELYEQVIKYYAAATRVYWGGDFNQTTDSLTAADPNFAFGLNQEADKCYSGAPSEQWSFRNSAGGLSKIDFLFRSGISRQACPVDAALTPSSPADMYPVGTFPSDHRILNGGQPF